MADLGALLNDLRREGIELWLDGDRLKLRSSQPVSERRRGELRAHREELVAFLRDDPESDDAPPLSFAQRGLLYLDRFANVGAAYNLSICCHIDGALDLQRFRRGFEHLTARHEVLHTRYDWNGAGPVLFIEPEQAADFEVVDAAGWSADELQAVLSAELDRAFDLAKSPPLRYRIFAVSEVSFTLLLVGHHIALDGTSLGLIFDELSAGYARDGADDDASGPGPAPLRYSDFARSQQRAARDGAFEDDLRYWTGQLQDAPEALDLPFDFRGVLDPSGAGAAVEFDWPAQFGARIVAAARARGMTPFMLLLGAFQLLLSRWTGQTDICVGVPHTVRPPAFDRHVGNFLNTLVLRGQIDPNWNADQFLGQVRTNAIEAFAHASVPFEQVVARLRKPRAAGENPLFQCLFSLDDVAQVPFRLGGLETRRIWPELNTAKFPLSLFVSLDGGVVHGTFEFATDHFCRETVEDLAVCLRSLIERLLDEPARQVGELEMLSIDQRRRIIVERNTSALHLGSARTLDALLVEALARGGNAPAIVHRGMPTSYAELAEAAKSIATMVAAAGLGPEAVVGVCLDRGPMLIAAILGVLQAGAAYLPLDPAYPSDRVAFMVADSRCRLILTQAEPLDCLSGAKAEIVELPSAFAALAPSKAGTQPKSVPGNLAYLIYTSGSTGRPKGVALTHANATAFLAWAGTAFSEESRSGMLATTSICFDLSVFELFLPLLAGGTIHLFDSAASLVEETPNPQTILLNTVPSAAAVLCATERLPPSLRTVNLAGEALKRQLVEDIHLGLPGIRLCNLYGPSEYTTYATWCEVHSAPGAEVDIGRPVANTRIYILDTALQPVLDGTPGEIHIAGEGLSRGYAHRPGLTGEKFIPDPFGPAGARMYATGDFGRFGRDGRIFYLGRRDQQVKIRGYRIELGEIEVRLSASPGVIESAVIVIQSERGPELVGHVATKTPAECNEQALRSALADTLPEYMIPRRWRFHEALPYNPNGKIDRSLLARDSERHGLARAAYAAPRNAAESYIAEVWREVLRVERVGIDDNFFELGGHSLLATAIVARLAVDRYPSAGLRDVFLAPTVRKLTEQLALASALPDRAIARTNRSHPIPASFTQQRMWFLQQLEPASGIYNLSVAWSLEGSLDVAVLERCLQEIVARHEILRTNFVPDEDAMLHQVISPSRNLKLTLADVTAAADAECDADEWLRMDAAVPFDLEAGQLFRAGVVQLAPDKHILQVGMPHIISDGWSIDVILSELGVLYPAFLRGAPSPLEPLPIQYADYAMWERDRLQDATTAAHFAYFRDLLAQAPNLLDLPTDRPRPPAATYRGAVHPFTIDSALSEALRAIARRRGVSLFMLLSAAFDVLLQSWSGQNDYCIGYSVGNRTRLETEGLIGPFVNTLVRRVRLSGDISFDEHLAEVARQMLETDPHQEYPFEKLVEELNPPRNLGHHPLFQVTYSFSTTHGPRTRKTGTLRGLGEKEVKLPGLDLGLVEPAYDSAKFDLALFISETGEEIEGDLEFASDLFDAATVRQIAERFEVLCRALAADDGGRVADLANAIFDATFTRWVTADTGTRAPQHSVDQSDARAGENRLPGLPQTSTERALASIWSELLDCSCDDRSASFFALGGHSLTAMRLIFWIRQRLGIAIALRTIFEAPTIAELADRVDAARRLDEDEPELTIAPLRRPSVWSDHAAPLREPPVQP